MIISFNFLRFNIITYYVYSVLSAYIPTCKKRAPDLIINNYETLCGY